MTETSKALQTTASVKQTHRGVEMRVLGKVSACLFSGKCACGEYNKYHCQYCCGHARDSNAATGEMSFAINNHS